MTAISNPNWVQALTYAASDDRAVLRTVFAAAGVVPGTLPVTQNGTPNMSVNVGPGQAVINRTGSSPADFYVAESPNSATNLTLSASDPTNPRIDLVIIRVNDAQYSGGTNNATVEIVTGTPAVSPVQPTTPNTALLLSTIAVAANATTIVNANITDKRVPFTRSAGLPTAVIFTGNGTLTAQQAQGATALRIRVQGAGGGSGGIPAGSAGNGTAAGGGGGGGYSETMVAASGQTYPLQVNVGAGGSAGASGSNAGGTGGNSSVITNNGAGVNLAQGNGGSGGAAGLATGSTTVTTASVSGGSAANGQINIAGSPGLPGVRYGATLSFGGSGGNSELGGAQVGGASQAGVTGQNYGGGAAGAAGTNAGAVGGAVGGAGIVIIEIFY